jgi:peptide/nickel transport system substrate-binding protein
MARGAALAAALVASLLAVSGAGGSGAVTPKRGGTVEVWATRLETACVTPMIDVCFSGRAVNPFSYSLAPTVLAGAFRIRPGATYEPYLVSHVDHTEKPPFTLTYHIRPEARWSDGVPVSAKDFIFTHKTLMRYKAQLFYGLEKPLGLIKEISAPDPMTVRVVLREPQETWRAVYFAIVLPRHVLEGEDYLSVWSERIENPKTGEPIGSGPLLLGSWERGRSLTLVRNPRYWGPHTAYVGRVVVRFDAALSPVESLAQGEVDIASALPSDLIPALGDIPGVQWHSGPAFSWDHLEVRLGWGGHPLLRSRLVRRALAYGIDRRKIVKDIFGETVAKQQVADSAIFPHSSPYYRKNWSQYRYRPAESRRLLEQAGCRRGTDDIYVCTGQRLSFRFATRGDSTIRRHTLELVRGQLREVGIEVVPEYASQQVLVNQIVPSGQFDLAEFAWVGPSDGESALRIFGCGGFLNYTGYCQRRVTADLERAKRILDADEWADVLNGADAQLARDVPVIPFYWGVGVTAHRATLRGVLYHPINILWNVENWWLEPEPER